MAIVVPAPTSAVASTCYAQNAALALMLKDLASASPQLYTGVHVSPYEVPLTSAWVAATDLTSLIKLANQIATFYGAVFVTSAPGQWIGHINDALQVPGGVAHLTADTTNTLSSAVQAGDLGTAETLVGLMRTQIQAHFTQTGVHVNNDSQTISATSITSLSTCITVANSIRTAMLAHIINAPNLTGSNSASAPFGLRVTAG